MGKDTMVKEIKNKAEFDEAIKGDKLVVVDFTATWCPPCQMIKPKFHELAEKETEVVFIAVDVDENAETAEACGITCMPTFQFYKGGAKVDELQGANYDGIVEKVNALKRPSNSSSSEPGLCVFPG